MNEIKGCEVCGSTDLRAVLNLGDHPMCDDLVAVNDPRIPVFYPISIAFCSVCQTAHQSYQIPKRTLFPDSYHYRARHTADVLNGMLELVERCELHVGQLTGLTVLDIGCNDGSLLSICKKKGAKTLGVEPTGAAVDAQQAGHQVYRDYFTPSLAELVVIEHGKPDIITFTNVFAHIEDLAGVVKALKILAGPKTLLVIENHYLGAVLDRYQFDTFYHEHPRTYSLTSFLKIAESLQAKVVAAEFPKRYGGNIRVMMEFQSVTSAHEGNALIATQVEAEEDFEARLIDMGRRIPLWRDAKRKEIETAAARYGALHGKAFPGRAAILVKLLDLDESLVRAVYEKPGSMKVGHYVPGTRIPILSDDEFASRADSDAPVLNLAWHISTEIHNYMRKNGYTGEIIDIFSAEEFDQFAH